MKFIWKGKRTRITNKILIQKNKDRRLTIPDFKNYSTSTIIKTMWYYLKNRQLKSGIE